MKKLLALVVVCLGLGLSWVNCGLAQFPPSLGPGGPVSLQYCTGPTPCVVSSSVVFCNAAAAPTTIDIPTLSPPGTGFYMIKIDASSNACVLTPIAAGAEINNASTLSVTTPYAVTPVFADPHSNFFGGLAQ